MTDKPLTEWAWEDHQAWEREWWGACTNTFAEESKQISIAHRMGLMVSTDPLGNERWPMYDLEGRSVLDIGGGPVSLLLKTYNSGARLVVDPCKYPPWVRARYKESGITAIMNQGENVMDLNTVTHFAPFDEVWIYNCLQHTDDPEKIVKNALRLGRVVRMFEWCNVGECAGHPHDLSAATLDYWVDDRGTLELLTGENACYGKAWYGVFKGQA